MTQETIKLNGTIYDSSSLADLKKWIDAAWKQEIFDFLSDWFNDSTEIITRTSGSTGTPKEIRLSKETMRNSACMTNAFFGLDASKSALLCLPASYIAGKMMLVRALMGGFDLVVVEPKANPFQDLQVAVDFTAITPYQLHHSADTLRSAPIKNIIVGGGHVSSELENLAEVIPARMYETYGMTETASHIALRCFNGSEKSDYFTALNGVAIRLDERGCLVINAPHLSAEELITNDIIELNGISQFKWLGRADSVINSGGVKIFPEQVEKKLESLIHQRFFISSEPDEQLGEKVVLVIESYGSGEYTELKNTLQMVLTKYEVPKAIYYVPLFVASAANKVLRSETIKLIKH